MCFGYSKNERDKMKYCLLCHRELDYKENFFQHFQERDGLCGGCKEQLKFLNVKTQLEDMPLHILYEYNDFLESMLYQFKEGRDIALANVFFQPFLIKLSSKFRHHVIVLMPSSKEKMVERGFLPVREMLKKCSLPLWEPFYKVNNRKQSMQSFEKRKTISQVIKRKENEEIPGRKLLLVDDVCTSGSTLLCAYHLLKEHRLKVEALVLCAHPLFVESCDEKGLLRKGSFSIL